MFNEPKNTPEETREGYPYVIAVAVFFILLWSRLVTTMSEVVLWTLIAGLASRFLIASYNARKRKQSSDSGQSETRRSES